MYMQPGGAANPAQVHNYMQSGGEANPTEYEEKDLWKSRAKQKKIGGVNSAEEETNTY